MTSDISLLHMLRRASQAADYLFAKEVDDRDITSRQFVVMQAIAAGDGVSQTTIVESTGIDRSTIADVVLRLQKKGLLVRKRSKDDARAYSVRLTEAGKKALEISQKAAKRVDGKLSTNLPEKKRDELLDILLGIAANMPNSELTAPAAKPKSRQPAGGSSRASGRL